jgi:hypothetical protein
MIDVPLQLNVIIAAGAPRGRGMEAAKIVIGGADAPLGLEGPGQDLRDVQHLNAFAGVP